MSTYRVNEFAKSTYCCVKGKAILFANGKSRWKLGSKYAKYVCLVFKGGDFPNRPMWFRMDELELINAKQNP